MLVSRYGLYEYVSYLIIFFLGSRGIGFGFLASGKPGFFRNKNYAINYGREEE